MDSDLFTGTRVRLDRLDPKPAAEAYHRWMQDSEMMRLMDSGIARMFSQSQHEKWQEKQLEPPTVNYFFHVIRLSDDQLIGDVGLDGIRWAHGECFVGIGIGERALWGQGYGTEAMRLILRFAFQELNLGGAGVAVRAFTVHELVAEKFRALLQQPIRKRNRRQDVYDIAFLIGEHDFGDADKTAILTTLIEKCRSRGIKAKPDSMDDPEIKQRAQADWNTLALEIGDLPPFEERFALMRALYVSLPWGSIKKAL